MFLDEVLYMYVLIDLLKNVWAHAWNVQNDPASYISAYNISRENVNHCH